MDTALRGKLATRNRSMPTRRTRRSRCSAPGEADVLAGIRPGLLMYAGVMAGTRVLADRYGRNVIALAVKKGEPGGSHSSANLPSRRGRTAR